MRRIGGEALQRIPAPRAAPASAPPSANGSAARVAPPSPPPPEPSRPECAPTTRRCPGRRPLLALRLPSPPAALPLACARPAGERREGEGRRPRLSGSASRELPPPSRASARWRCSWESLAGALCPRAGGRGRGALNRGPLQPAACRFSPSPPLETLAAASKAKPRACARNPLPGAAPLVSAKAWRRAQGQVGRWRHTGHLSEAGL